MFENKFILVAGASGFLGGKLVKRLRGLGARVVGTSSGTTARRSEFPSYNLCDPRATQQLFTDYQFDYVFNCAGYNGGIQFCLENPADIYFRNTTMGLNVLNACHLTGVKKIVSVVASCAYPSELPYAEQDGYLDWAPLGICEEKDFHRESPHESVACHGFAKRNLQLASHYYHSQYGLDAVTVCPATLYGPGQNYSLWSTKVVAAMVKRFCDAAHDNLPSVTCWGTGSPLREVMHVEDCVSLMLATFEGHNDHEFPLNIGTGQEVSVKSLAETVSGIADYRGSILWEATKPDGQFRKRLDLTRMTQLVPDFKPVDLVVGLGETVADYKRAMCKN